MRNRVGAQARGFVCAKCCARNDQRRAAVGEEIRCDTKEWRVERTVGKERRRPVRQLKG